MTWHEFILDFLTSLRAGHKSEETIKHRRLQLQRVAHDLAPINPGGVTTDDLATWLADHDWSKATMRSHRAALRSAFAWAARTGRIHQDPAFDLPPVGVSPPMPRPTPDAVLGQSLALADGRQRLLIRLAAELGLRRGEACQVHGNDLEQGPSGQQLTVHGKGSRRRVVPATASLANAIRDAAKDGGGYCFPGKINGHLSPAYAGRIVSRILPAPYTMHKLRHRFASAAYAIDHDIVTVQQLLGHASPATTQAYVAVTSDAKRRLVEAITL